MSADLAARIAGWRADVERTLEHALASRADAAPALEDAMRYAALGGGKRLRPLLVLGACECAGGRSAEALPAAAAIELIHAYSLVHDDLPAMDDAPLRRGKPSVHTSHGEALAILAGDALQSLAFETLASAPLPPERIVRQVRTLAQASGVAGMAGGQTLDLAAEGEPVDEALVTRIHRLKTGALLAGAFTLGAEAAGANQDVVARLTATGCTVGLAFQIQDDVLDEVSSAEALGKHTGQDREVGKATWPRAVGLATSQRMVAELTAQALAEFDPFGPRAEALRALVAGAGVRSA